MDQNIEYPDGRSAAQSAGQRKNTVLLFSKVPEVGLVKTRLTVLKDGMFPPETAAHLYHCMLFDVVEIISAALADLDAQARREGAGDTYELVISTTPASNVPVMEKLFADAGEWPWPIRFIADEGASFDEHYNHAFRQCWDGGSDCILSMGADMPALTKRDIIFGFQQLHRLDDGAAHPAGGIVLAPDQEMGVSAVGWTRRTDFDHGGVYYCQDGLTVLPAYIKKAERQGLPALWLPPIPDVDTMADLFHNVTLVNALMYCAEADDICPPWRTAQAMADMGFGEIRVAPNDLRDPRDRIDV